MSCPASEEKAGSWLELTFGWKRIGSCFAQGIREKAVVELVELSLTQLANAVDSQSCCFELTETPGFVRAPPDECFLEGFEVGDHSATTLSHIHIGRVWLLWHNYDDRVVFKE